MRRAERKSDLMSLDVRQAWLTRAAFDWARRELSALINERHADGIEVRDVADDMHRELRIRHLQELVQTALVQEAPDDGVAEPGMVVTVRNEGEDATETYLMANREESAAADLCIEICSPQSPLGIALFGAIAGDEREFATPDGQRVRVTVLSALPHRAE
jgi:transcription elongation factor GreA